MSPLDVAHSSATHFPPAGWPLRWFPPSPAQQGPCTELWEVTLPCGGARATCGRGGSEGGCALPLWSCSPGQGARGSCHGTTHAGGPTGLGREGWRHGWMDRRMDRWMDEEVNEWKDGWREGWMGRRRDGWTSGQMEGWVHGLTDRRTGEWMGRWIQGWMDRWTDGQVARGMDRQTYVRMDRWLAG